MTDTVLSYKTDTTVEDYTATLERLEITLMTEKGAISSNPSFGFGVSGIVDHQLTPELQHAIKAELLQLVTRYFPEIELLGLKISKPLLGTLKIELSIRILTSDKVLGLSLEYSGE